MQKRTLIFAGLTTAVAATVIGTVWAQQSPRASSAAPTLQDVVKRLTALEAENHDLKKRIEVLEKETGEIKKSAVLGHVWQPPSYPDGSYNLYLKPDVTTVTPPSYYGALGSDGRIITSPMIHQMPPLQRQPLRWDPNGKYDLLIQKPQTAP